MNNAQCQSTKKDGSPCEASAVSGGNFCINHEPAMKDVKRMAVLRGGYSRKRPPLPPIELNEYKDVMPALQKVFDDLRAHLITSTEANAQVRLIKLKARMLLGLSVKDIEGL